MATFDPIADDLLGAFEGDCAASQDKDRRNNQPGESRVLMKYFGQTIARLRIAEAALGRTCGPAKTTLTPTAVSPSATALRVEAAAYEAGYARARADAVLIAAAWYRERRDRAANAIAEQIRNLPVGAAAAQSLANDPEDDPPESR